MRRVSFVVAVIALVGGSIPPASVVVPEVEAEREAEALRRDAAQSRAVLLKELIDLGARDVELAGVLYITHIVQSEHACGLRRSDIGDSSCDEGEDVVLEASLPAAGAGSNDGKSGLMFLQPVIGRPDVPRASPNVMQLSVCASRASPCFSLSTKR